MQEPLDHAQFLWFQCALARGWTRDRLSVVASYVEPGAVIVDCDDEVKICYPFGRREYFVFTRGEDDPVRHCRYDVDAEPAPAPKAARSSRKSKKAPELPMDASPAASIASDQAPKDVTSSLPLQSNIEVDPGLDPSSTTRESVQLPLFA